MNREDEKGWRYPLQVPKQDALIYLIEGTMRIDPSEPIKVRFGDHMEEGLPKSILEKVKRYQGPGPFELYAGKEEDYASLKEGESPTKDSA